MKLSQLVQSRFNKRREYPEEMLEDLASSIKEHGLISRISLRTIGDKWEVLAGWRRRKALELLYGPDYEIPKDDYRILAISDYEAVKLSITENVQRVNLSALDMAEAAKALIEENAKLKPKDIASILWTTEARAKRLLGMEEHLASLPQSAIESLGTPDENDPAFTDSHLDAMAKSGAFDLSDTQVKDLCDLIISQEVPASRVQGIVDKMVAKEAPSPAEGDGPEGEEGDKKEDPAMVDKYEGVLKYDDAGDLFIEGKKEIKPVDLGYYHPFIKDPQKFRVHIKAKVKIDTLE
jgi:ParB/RepB/Spo0J family partition protein